MSKISSRFLTRKPQKINRKNLENKEKKPLYLFIEKNEYNDKNHFYSVLHNYWSIRKEKENQKIKAITEEIEKKKNEEMYHKVPMSKGSKIINKRLENKSKIFGKKINYMRLNSFTSNGSSNFEGDFYINENMTNFSYQTDNQDDMEQKAFYARKMLNNYYNNKNFTENNKNNNNKIVNKNNNKNEYKVDITQSNIIEEKSMITSTSKEKVSPKKDNINQNINMLKKISNINKNNQNKNILKNNIIYEYNKNKPFYNLIKNKAIANRRKVYLLQRQSNQNNNQNNPYKYSSIYSSINNDQYREKIKKILEDKNNNTMINRSYNNKNKTLTFENENFNSFKERTEKRKEVNDKLSYILYDELKNISNNLDLYNSKLRVNSEMKNNFLEKINKKMKFIYNNRKKNDDNNKKIEISSLKSFEFQRNFHL